MASVWLSDKKVKPSLEGRGLYPHIVADKLTKDVVVAEGAPEAVTAHPSEQNIKPQIQANVICDQTLKKLWLPDEYSSNVIPTNPTTTGKKERKSELSESDEYYIRDYGPLLSRDQLKEPIRLESHMHQWELKLGGSVCGRPVSINGNIIFVTYDRQLMMVNGDDGSLIKRKDLWNQPIGQLIEHRGGIIVFMRNGTISKHELPSLNKVWTSRLAVQTKKDELDISISGAVLDRDKIYISKHWGNLYVVDAIHGRMLADPGMSYESRINIPAVFYKDWVIYSNVAGEILAFPRDGEKNLKLKIILPSGYATSMIQENGMIYCLTSDRTLYCINLLTQKFLWEKNVKGYGFKSLAFRDGKLYVASGDLYALDAESGKELWVIESDEEWGYCRSAPIIKGDQLIALSCMGKILKCDLKTGEHILEKKFKGEFWNPILLNSDKIYLSNAQGQLFCTLF